jgi:UDP-N-acetylglucosamine 2-epimerase
MNLLAQYLVLAIHQRLKERDMKVTSVVGVRPEFVQAAPMIQVLRARRQEVLLHVGQHYDYEMSAVLLQELGLSPDYNLEVGSGLYSH